MGLSGSPCRLTAVLTHPVQYYAPWFRHIAARRPEIELSVLYATQPTPRQQGVGFGKTFQWDVPLTEGYRCRVVRPAREGESVHSDHFWGLDVPEIGDALAGTEPDVAMICGWYSVTLLRALWTARARGIPALYRGDTHLGNAPGGWRRLAWEAKTRALLGAFDGWLSAGRQTREYLAHFGAPSARVFDAPHCVDNEFFAASAAPHQSGAARAAAREAIGLGERDAFAVLFVGKLDPVKRPLDLVRAVARLGEGAALVVAGAGPLEGACREEAARLGVRAVFLGFVNQSELGRIYAAADCLALPSQSGRLDPADPNALAARGEAVAQSGETWGLVVNEALATGLPCVVSDEVGCAPDLVTPGETGEIFGAGDVEGLASALGRVRAAIGRGRDFGPACRRRAEAYSFDAAAQGLARACMALRRGGARASNGAAR